MYLALLKLFRVLLEAVDWLRLHALRYFASPIFQSGSGNVGERAAKLPLSDWRYPITVVLALLEACVLSVWQIFKWLFFFNTRSIFEFFLSGVKIVLVCAVLSVIGLYGYLSGSANPEILAHYKTLHQQNTSTALLGRDGSIIGVITNPLLVSNSNGPGRLYAEMVPPVYWDILDYKTQRQIDFDFEKTTLSDVILWRQNHYKGISLSSLLDAINPFSDASKQSLISDLTFNLKGNGVMADCPSVLFKLCQTIDSIHLAKHTFPYLAKNKGAEFKRWTAIHGSLKGFQGDVTGLRATAEVVFSKKAEQLSNAEQAMLAIAQINNEPLLDNQGIALIKAQAITIAKALYARSQPALATNIEQGVLGIDLTKPLKPKGFSRRPKFARTKLLNRSQKTIGNFVDLVEQQLSDEYQVTGNQRIISDVQVTLPVKDNDKFKQQLLARFNTLQNQCEDCGLRYRLGKKVGDGGANIEIAVADQEGQIVRYIKRGKITERAIGALSVVPATVLLSSLGNLPNSRFCNQTYRNLTSSVSQFPKGLINCETLDELGHSLSFQEAIQIRASLPLFYALRKQPSTQQLQELYRDFGLTDLRTKAGNASHGEQLAYEMSYGVVQSVPLQQLDVIHQLGDVLYGRSQSKAILAISQFLVSDLDEGRRYLEFNKTSSSIEAIGDYLRTQNSKATLRQLLSYDVNSKNARLKSLKSIKNVRFLLTKTGQSYTKQQKLRDHWLIASVLIRGRRYSMVAFIGSLAADQAGLAETLTAEQIFEPIVAGIIDSLD